MLPWMNLYNDEHAIKAAEIVLEKKGCKTFHIVTENEKNNPGLQKTRKIIQDVN